MKEAVKKMINPLDNKYEKFYSPNQREVAKRISGGDYELVIGWGWDFLGSFLSFCWMINIFSLFAETPAIGYQRKMFEMWKLLTLYLFKQLLGIKSMNELPEELFSDIGLLKCLGFKTDEISHGTNNRGNGMSGPLHKDTLSDGLAKICPSDIEELFNKIITKVVKFGIIGDKITGIVDATNLETTELYENCGMKTIEHKKYDKKGRQVIIEEKIYGFKVIFLYDYVSRIPLSAKVVQIQEHENQYLLPLILQTIKNGVKIEKLLIDRGFIDGEQLWRIKNEYGMDFVVPSKTNMAIATEARSFRNNSGVVWAEREAKPKNNIKRIKLYGISDLKVWDKYVNPEKKNEKNRKEFMPDSLNAIVTTEWDKFVFKVGEEPVIITTFPVDDPLKIDELYDLRSLIENQGNRELKQAWNLKKYPQKTEWALKAHVFMTLIAYALCHAFRTSMGQNLAVQGDRKFRRSEKCRKLIVFAGDFYGIYEIEEFALLLGKGPKNMIRASPDRVVELLKGESLLVG